IKWAMSEGCSWYDFRGGYPDENNPLHGIYKFKKGFCENYMEFMGEADMILSKPAFKLVEIASKTMKTVRKKLRK
ncbi:MAG: peptidoglycan bridge formation glycyltransferase FemA/FemB family protein, partial [Clostridiales bacterium]|nr:peptidoglycan bridge formation glycyltransferase FemA/FemB family protein [Clostridiales bacterium]